MIQEFNEEELSFQFLKFLCQSSQLSIMIVLMENRILLLMSLQVMLIFLLYSLDNVMEKQVNWLNVATPLWRVLNSHWVRNCSQTWQTCYTPFSRKLWVASFFFSFTNLKSDQDRTLNVDSAQTTTTRKSIYVGFVDFWQICMSSFQIHSKYVVLCTLSLEVSFIFVMKFAIKFTVQSIQLYNAN